MIYALDGIAPQIDATAWIAPNATIIGRVVVGAGASVWFGVTIRGDNDPITIGAGTNVQEHAVFHTDLGCPLTIGTGCTIGHKAMLHGCTIGDNTLVGMGATILNRAVIGRDCLIGAGALVTEDKVIPDGSLVVGSPGRIIRQLDAAAIDGLRRSAAHYQYNAARFRAGLQEI